MHKRNSVMQHVGIFHQYNEDENQERGNWARKLDFLLSLIGYAVGLGNIWRFPYKLYDHGASLLIPYGIMMTLAGIPLFFMEMCLGQFSSQGPISLWKVSPLFKGVGWAMVIISYLVCIYYNMVIAYTIFYFFASCNSKLPWADCQDDWLQYGCTPKNANATMRNITRISCEVLTANSSAHSPFECNGKSPSEIYWDHVVLQQSNSISEGSSTIHWHLVLCLLAAWLITYLSLCRGIRSSVKVVYVTATLPFVILGVILLKNVSLPGAVDGIKSYFVPKFEELKQMKVWYTAGTQAFYTLGIAFGGLQTMASYNRFHNNVYSDSVLVPAVNCVTSITAGLVIFTVMGFISHEIGQAIPEAVQTGPGLAFIAYPTGLAMMPGAPFWSALFFVLLCTLGLDTQNGVYIMHFMDWYSASYSLMVIALLEVIVVMWVYGCNSLCKDIEMMTGCYPNIYWRTCWIVFSPALILFILVAAVIGYSDIQLDDYVYKAEINYIGFAIVAIELVPVLLCAGIEIRKNYTEASIVKAIKKSMKPAQDWGPRLDKFRTGSRYGPLHPTFSDFNDNNQSRKPTSNCCCTTDVDVRTTDVDVRTTVHVRQRSQTHGIQPITVQNSNNIHVTHM